MPRISNLCLWRVLIITLTILIILIVRKRQSNINLSKDELIDEETTYYEDDEKSDRNERDILENGKTGDQGEKSLKNSNYPPKATCVPKRNVALAVPHYSGSSAIQRIIYHFGMMKNLNFTLGKESQFSPLHPFKREMIFPNTTTTKVKLNVFASRAKWNMEEIKSLLPPDTVFITMLREPTELFKIMFEEENFASILNTNIEFYIDQTNLMDDRLHQVFGYNQMSFDLGLLQGDIMKDMKVIRMIQLLDEHFDLVMLKEKMEESLVLLRDLLCWEPADMVVFTVDDKPPVELNAEKVLRKRLEPDILLYNHFSDKFNNLIKEFGEEKMRREKKLIKKEKDKLETFCQIKQTPKLTPLDTGFSTRSDVRECQLFTIHEDEMIDIFRMRMRRYLK